MAHQFEAGADALVMDARDHVATALRDIAAGETIRYLRGGSLETVTLLDPVPFGHKVSIAAIDAGSEVRKYGEVIGRSTAAIERGRHVHVHNIEGIRGRGDMAQTKKEGASA
ncbi:D-galactarate dehydratase [Gordoniibacillus kamchatkensis]|uniref:D-galactarate dehydratase n=1 Tax=Gordoniibacillus kamchatkensis TaxID=1590651 RepID=A0ABR5AHK1_9BACL|nr:UxaA family hydrolase [Paenibacillus sp. VKM B-2647]KIL40529.1 D-galactarate dehydratase [Paenibacillus sp. VKM B-2647]